MHLRKKHAAGSIVASILLGLSASANATVIEEITVTHQVVTPSAEQKSTPWSRGDRKALTAHLELNTEQRREITSILADVRPELDELRELRRSNRDALDSLDATSDTDVVALERLTSERGQLVASTDEVRERIRAEVDSVLSQDQQIRFAGLFDAVPSPVLDSSTVQIGTDTVIAD